jgi:hypothetical protein
LLATPRGNRCWTQDDGEQRAVHRVAVARELAGFIWGLMTDRIELA